MGLASLALQPSCRAPGTGGASTTWPTGQGVTAETNLPTKWSATENVKWKVPIVITSLGAREDVNQAVRGYGGITLHDVIHNRYAHKAIEKGATGLIAVAAGAGSCRDGSSTGKVNEKRQPTTAVPL